MLLPLPTIRKINIRERLEREREEKRGERKWRREEKRKTYTFSLSFFPTKIKSSANYPPPFYHTHFLIHVFRLLHHPPLLRLPLHHQLRRRGEQRAGRSDSRENWLRRPQIQVAAAAIAALEPALRRLSFFLVRYSPRPQPRGASGFADYAFCFQREFSAPHRENFPIVFFCSGAISFDFSCFEGCLELCVQLFHLIFFFATFEFADFAVSDHRYFSDSGFRLEQQLRSEPTAAAATTTVRCKNRTEEFLRFLLPNPKTLHTLWFGMFKCLLSSFSL